MQLSGAKIQYHNNSPVPVADDDVVGKKFVVDMVAQGTGAIVLGQVYVTDVTPTSTGVVGSKTYVAGTVPANSLVSAATSDTANVRVSVLAEGGSAFYSPTITINGVTATLSEVAGDKRMFTGYADLTISSTSTVNVVSSTGASTNVVVNRAGAGPATQTLVISALPGSQTEAKSGDVVSITGTVENSAVYSEVVAGGAATALVSLTVGAADSGGAGYKTISGSFVASALSGSQLVTVRSKNALGSFGTSKTASVTLNQTFPSIGAITVSYPVGQTALKGSESATVSSTITNFDSVAYSSSADLSTASPSAYAVGKTVSRVGGSYVYATNNYTITATKASNGAVSTRQGQVNIANAAATASIAITGSPARLISSAAGQTYQVVVTPNQATTVAPSLSASVGAWSGSWTPSGSTWTRNLVITDANAKGSATFSGLQVTGLAGVVGSSITAGASYVVGGFLRRLITVPAFAQIVPIGTSVVTIAKTDAKYSGASGNLTLFNDNGQHFQGYTITDAAGNYSATGSYMFISDSAYAGANTSGTLIVEIEEVA